MTLPETSSLFLVICTYALVRPYRDQLRFSLFFFCFFFVFRNNGRVRVLFQFVRAFLEEIVVKWVFYLI